LVQATAVREVVSAGFQRLVLPHTRLRAAFQKNTAQGKLKAVTMPTWPLSGFHRSIMKCPGLGWW
jgi:hypothetical protein